MFTDEDITKGFGLLKDFVNYELAEDNDSLFCFTDPNRKQYPDSLRFILADRLFIKYKILDFISGYTNLLLSDLNNVKVKFYKTELFNNVYKYQYKHQYKFQKIKIYLYTKRARDEDTLPTLFCFNYLTKTFCSMPTTIINKNTQYYIENEHDAHLINSILVFIFGQE